MKIGDKVYVRGCVDEIRQDTIIIRNDGGYFGTIPNEVVEQKSSEDAVSRKALLDKAYAYGNGLEPEETLQNLTKPNKSDCISRKAAIDVLDTGLWGVEWDKALAIAMLKDLSSAEPKCGKWISAAEYCEYLEKETGERYQPSGMGNPVYCDQCWSGTIKKFDFCPNCGCAMERSE